VSIKEFVWWIEEQVEDPRSGVEEGESDEEVK
jgi:hypothetical protein